MQRKSAAELIAIADDTAQQLLAVTVPIYQGAETERPSVVGSGILVAISNIRLLMTAGHVLDLVATDQLFAGASPELICVEGDPTRLQTAGAKTQIDDKIDVGVVRLMGDIWDCIPLERFLASDALDTDIPIAAHHTYGLVGFPNSMNRRAPVDDRIRAAAFGMAGLECDAQTYAKTSTDPGTNVMVGFDKNTMWSKTGQVTAPDLYGASGAGIWRYGRRLRGSAGVPKLSAIATEWHPKGRHRHVLGTRIPLILGALADKYDDVRQLIAKNSHSEP